MDTKPYFRTNIIKNSLFIASLCILPLYMYLSFTNHLLFHTIATFAIITIGVVASVVGVFTSLRVRNTVISKLSPAIFIYIILLFIHTLSYNGMSIFTNLNESFTSQILLVANLFLAIAWLITSLLPNKKENVYISFAGSLFLGMIFFSIAYYNVLPATISNGAMTVFGQTIQWITIAFYLIGIILLLLNKNFRANKDYQSILIAFILFLLSEILLLNHFSSEGFNIFIGLSLKFIGFLLIMYCIFVVNLIRPYNVLYTAIIEDNLLQRKLKEDNQNFSRRLSRSQEIAHVGTWELNLKTKVMWASDEAFRIYCLDVSKNNIINYEDIKHVALDIDRPRLDEALENLIYENIDYNITFAIENKHGEIKYINSVATLKYEDNEPAFVYGVINDITDLKNEQDKLLYASYHDHLTNVYNRRFFLEQRITLNFERFLPISTYILDINGLKIINDSFGHHVGNQVLKKLSTIINEFITKENCFVARIGGDEFAIILPNTNRSEAEKIMEAIINKTQDEKIGNINLSVAYGLAVKDKIEQPFDEILKEAEDDMYLHKISDSQSVRNGIIDALLKTLYEKDVLSENHSRRVSDLAYKLAKAVNLSEKNAGDIKVAGILHDIGKIMIANNILDKEGKLTNEEYDIIKTHPEKGYKIIHSIGGMDIIANYVLQHHERYDGSGYPRKLSKEDISYEGRIICIADAFDAMTSYRSYKDQLTTEEAIIELKACKGKQFDPELVDVFIEKVIETK